MKGLDTTLKLIRGFLVLFSLLVIGSLVFIYFSDRSWPAVTAAISGIVEFMLCFLNAHFTKLQNEEQDSKIKQANDTSAEAKKLAEEAKQNSGLYWTVWEEIDKDTPEDSTQQ